MVLAKAIKKKFRKNEIDLIEISIWLVLLATAPLFFYKLGNTTLISWDEAWYAEIARNILKTGDFLKLSWIDKPYFDHPPTGFWAEAISFKFFGVNEFTARFPQALAGFLSVFLVYLIGKNLFHRVVGVSAAIILATSAWFVFRARSGNLDAMLVFFLLATVYCAVKAATNPRWLNLTAISAGFLVLTKSVIGVGFIPLVLIIFWRSAPFSIFQVLTSLAIFLIIVMPWYLTNYSAYGETFVKQHFFRVGLPGVGESSDFGTNLNLMLFYLHMGVRKWYYPGIFALLGNLAFLRQKRILLLIVWFIVFFSPFISSQKGHIWHLLPLHPVVGLVFGAFVFLAGSNLGSFFQTRVLPKLKPVFHLPNFIFSKELAKTLTSFLLLGFTVVIAAKQIQIFYPEFINRPDFKSDDAVLSAAASEYYGLPLYLDGDYDPTAIFYSGKKVINLKGVSGYDVAQLFEKEKKSFLFLTKEWRLEDAAIPNNSYKLIARRNDNMLILVER